MDHSEYKHEFTQTGPQGVAANSGLRPQTQLMLVAHLKELRSLAGVEQCGAAWSSTAISCQSCQTLCVTVWAFCASACTNIFEKAGPSDIQGVQDYTSQTPQLNTALNASGIRDAN